jgi:two-component system sensor histidine kinase UhpB
MLLQIQSIHADAPETLRPELDELRESARNGAEDVRRIAQRLRPEALEELGLQSALVALSDAFAGMRERAMLIGATLHIEPSPEDGTEVLLNVPRRTS